MRKARRRTGRAFSSGLRGWGVADRAAGSLHEVQRGPSGLLLRWRAFHGFTPLRMSLNCEITCGARLAPSIHVQATSRTTSDIVMQIDQRALGGLAGGPQDVVDFDLADDPLGPGHAELAGNPAGGRG